MSTKRRTAWTTAGLLLLAVPLLATVLQTGDGGSALATVDTTRKALRVTTEPNEALGHYSLGQGTLTGIATAAADAEVFQFRNSTTTKVVIERVTVQMVLVAAITTGQELSARVEKATAWSAQGTGGTALDTPTRRRDSGMSASAMASGDIRIATTAALGAGTKTIATRPMFICGFQMNAFTVGNMSQVCEVETRDNKYSLMVLDQNEGFVIRNVIALATGTGKWIVTVQWREATAY